MTIATTFTTASDTGFTPAVQELAWLSTRVTRLAGEWEAMGPHPYSTRMRQRNFSRFELWRSSKGVTGVVVTLSRDEAVASLLTARHAAFSGMPVAPTFHAGSDGQLHQILSVIPFTSIVYGGVKDKAVPPYINTMAYWQHYASTLPFMLMHGMDMGRGWQNQCMSAVTPHFAEFDFANTDLTAVLDAARGSETARARVDAAATQDNFTSHLNADDAARPLVREHFNAGVMRVQNLTSHVTARALDSIRSVLPVSDKAEDEIQRFLQSRRKNFAFSLKKGDFDDSMTTDKPRTSTLAMFAYMRRNTYRFN